MPRLLNIVGSKGDKNDPSFRYKMPPVIGKIEGRGNGIKTVIANGEEVASALHRPVTHLTKFFGCELGAQSKYDAKNEKAIVNGAHETSTLQELVTLYCDKFVLCEQCNLPETDLRIKSSKKEIWQKCSACGHKAMCDMTHKLCTFILKDAKARKTKKAEKEEKKKRKKEKKKGKKSKDAAGGEDKKKKEKKAKKGAAAAAAAAGGEASSSRTDEDGVMWHTDFSDEAVKMRRLAEMSKMQKAKEGAAAPEDEAEETDEQVLANCVSRLQQEMATTTDVKQLGELAINLQAAACFAPAIRMKIAYDAAFRPCTSVPAFTAATGKWSPFLVHLGQTVGNPEQAQGGVLEAVDAHFAEPKFAGLAGVVPLLLQQLYENDVVEEDAVIAWHGSAAEGDAVKKVRAAATKFVAWLQEAESDEEED